MSEFVPPPDWQEQSYNSYPDPDDVTRYYVMGHHGAVSFQCPPGMVFDPVLHYCVPETSA